MSIVFTILLGAIVVTVAALILCVTGHVVQRLGFMADANPATAGVVALAVIACTLFGMMIVGEGALYLWARAVRGSAYRWERPTGPSTISHRSEVSSRPALHDVAFLARASSRTRPSCKEQRSAL